MIWLNTKSLLSVKHNASNFLRSCPSFPGSPFAALPLCVRKYLGFPRLMLKKSPRPCFVTSGSATFAVLKT
ncbi:hypothetical protein BH09VER1_BH09VER1_55020 [soil metagenome]